MKLTIKELITEMNKIVPMEMNHPVNREALANSLLNEMDRIPKSLRELWEVTNGCEINVPGTEIYSVSEMEKNMKNTIDGWFPLGRFNFGDSLYISKEGMIVQIDHETGEKFLEWMSLEQFLEDELDGCRNCI